MTRRTILPRAWRSLFGDVRADTFGDLPASTVLARCSVGIILIALLANEIVLKRYFSADGVLETDSVHAIRWTQIALCLIGIVLLTRRRVLLLGLLIGLAAGNLLALHDGARTLIASTRLLVLDDRLAALRTSLPATGHVGYISDETTDGYGYVTTFRYYLTQYAVVPIVVEAGPTQDLIIGNFSTFDPSHPPDHLSIIRNFGNGIVLFRKKVPE